MATADDSIIQTPLYLRQPSPGLQLAMDPRIPDEHEAFALILSETPLETSSVEWLIDEEVVGTTASDVNQFLWSIKRGTHVAQARIWAIDSEEPLTTPVVRFSVK